MISESLYCLYPYGYIIKNYKDVHISKGMGKWSREINTRQIIQFLKYKILVSDISYLLEIFPIIWYLSQVLTNSLAFLNKQCQK